MKTIIAALLVTLLIPVLVIFGSDNTVKQATPAKSTTGQTSITKKSSNGDTLSAEEIAQFVQEWTDDKSDKKMQFVASFGMPSLDTEQKKHYKHSGKIPYRLTCTLSTIKGTGQKQLSKREDGTAYFYIMDSEGAVIEKKSMALEKMCPS